MDNNCYYLNGNSVIIEGKKFYGIPLFVEDQVSVLTHIFCIFAKASIIVFSLIRTNLKYKLMQSTQIFKEYIWLVNTIYKHKRISLREINKLWVETDMSGGLPLPRTTFNRHKDAIEDIFGLYIECDFRDHFKYYIGNAHVLEEDSIQNWMLSTLSVNNIISENKSVHNRIVLESIPSNGEYLQTVIDAMKKNKMVRFTYHKYGSSETTERIVEPYLVKLFLRRWYMICRYPETNQFRIFAFDRMLSLEPSDVNFKMDKEFEASEYFEECFGIVKDVDIAEERVVVRAYGNERYYLRDLPIHTTQKLINKGDGFVDYECRLRPSLDFLGFLLSKGCFIKVIEPQWVADKVKQMHMDAVKRYEM